MLKFSEDELKRVTEEKKHALDELLKQSVKGSNSNSRKRLNSQQQQQTAEDTYDGPSQQSPEKSSTKRKESPRKAVGRSQRSAKKAQQQPPATVKDEDEQEQCTHITTGDAFQIELHDIKQQPLAPDTTEDVTEDTQQQLKTSPRKPIPSSSTSRNTPRGRSADLFDDSDFTPKRKKVTDTPTFQRLTRSTRKCVIKNKKIHESIVISDSSGTEESHQKPKRIDLISDTESDGGDVFDDINSDEDKDNTNEDDYVYCTSVALSPIKLPILEPVADVLEKHKQQQKQQLKQQQQQMKENQPSTSAGLDDTKNKRKGKRLMKRIQQVFTDSPAAGNLQNIENHENLETAVRRSTRNRGRIL